LARRKAISTNRDMLDLFSTPTLEKKILNTLACFIGIYIVTINVKYVPAEGSIYTSNALKRIQEQRFAKAHEAVTRT